MLGLDITDSQELEHLGVNLTSMLHDDIRRDPQVIVQAYRVITSNLQSLDEVTSQHVDSHPEDAVEIAGKINYDFLRSYRTIKEAAESIMRGDPDYSSILVAAALAVTVTSQIELRARADRKAYK
jgi:hypothetical protein